MPRLRIVNPGIMARSLRAIENAVDVVPLGGTRAARSR
jgi:hypothetical protein